MSSRGRWTKRVLWGAASAALVYLLWSVWDHDAVMQWLQRAPPLPFFALMALLPMVGVPVTPFFVLSGATFGLRVGVLGSLSALAVNLVACYAVARALRPRIEALLRRLGYELPDFSSRETGSLRKALAVKLAPGIPAFVKNYGLAIAGVDFLPYFGLSILSTGTYGILAIVFGDSLFDHEIDRILLVAAAGVALALGFGWWRRRASRKPAAKN